MVLWGTHDRILSRTTNLDSLRAQTNLFSVTSGLLLGASAGCGAAAALIGQRPLSLATDVPATLASWIGNRTYDQLFQV